MNDSSNPNHIGDDSVQRTSLGRRLQHALTGSPNRRFPGLHSPPGGAASHSLLLNRRLAFPTLALLALLTASLLFLLPGGLLHAQEAAIQYPENGTGPVATYTAVDPEEAEIVWELAGDDAAASRLKVACSPSVPHLTTKARRTLAITTCIKLRFRPVMAA